MNSMTGIAFCEFWNSSFRYYVFSVKQIDYFQRTFSFLPIEIDESKERKHADLKLLANADFQKDLFVSIGVLKCQNLEIDR